MSQMLSGHRISPIIIIALVVVVLGGAVAYALNRTSAVMEGEVAGSPSPVASATPMATQVSWPVGTALTWSATEKGDWMTFPYDSVPPACPDPLVLQLPTPNIAKATSILYPGQSRSGTFEGKGSTYKSHGGIRFDGSANEDISVVMPFNGAVMRGSKTLINGEMQYGFDIVNQCGVMVRIGHLLQLSPAFQAIADTFPVGSVASSEFSKVAPLVEFKQGDVIATAVGFKSDKNVGFDYGVYDFRSNNAASQNAAYKSTHASTAETSFHGLCWLENLSAADSATVKALPGGDGAVGKQSDYCK